MDHEPVPALDVPNQLRPEQIAGRVVADRLRVPGIDQEPLPEAEGAASRGFDTVREVVGFIWKLSFD